MNNRKTDKTTQLTNAHNFRAKVDAILKNGHGCGYPLIIHNALRSPDEQNRLVDQGFSKSKNSRHLPGRDGLARAADVVDERFMWGAPRHVWVLIGRLALTQGCKWGGLYGLPWLMRRKLAAFLLDRTTPFDPKAWRGKIGWDPAHIEMK
jgi:hypothetical protein